MSNDHSTRLWKVCNDALLKASLGEPYGVAVEFTFAPFVNGEGMVVGLEPAWFVIVTIRSPLVGEPDIGHGIPVFGVMPSDKTFREIATGLLDQCRQEAAQKTAIATLGAQRAAAKA